MKEFKKYEQCTLNASYLNYPTWDKTLQIYGVDEQGSMVLISRRLIWTTAVYDGVYCPMFGKRIPWEMVVAMNVLFTVVADDHNIIEAEVCGDDLPEDVQVTLMEDY